MRLTCPLCGPRDRREYSVMGADRALQRPSFDMDGEAAADLWHDYLYLRDNPAGESRELWQHFAGCGEWLHVTRDTRSHHIAQIRLLADVVKGQTFVPATALAPASPAVVQKSDTDLGAAPVAAKSPRARKKPAKPEAQS